MGAILADFPQLPVDADPNRVALYQGVFADLARLGLTLPVQPVATITRAQLLAHLRALAGTIIGSEITNDPEGVDYQGANDATQRDLINDPSQRRVNAVRYTIALPLSMTVLTTLEGGLLALALALENGGLVGKRVRFTRNTATAALRGVTATILSTVDLAITLDAALPASPAVGDRFRILHPRAVRPRINEVLLLPYAPNVIDTADVTAAKV